MRGGALECVPILYGTLLRYELHTRNPGPVCTAPTYTCRPGTTSQVQAHAFPTPPTPWEQSPPEGNPVLTPITVGQHSSPGRRGLDPRALLVWGPISTWS